MGIKIVNLPPVVTPAQTDVFPISQGGVTYKETVTQLGSLVLLLTGGTMSGSLILAGDPTANLEAATKQYVDAVATGLNVQPACNLATTGALTVVYNNGVSGVGATLTNNTTLAALTIDGVLTTVGMRILVKDQAAATQNGIYTVTTVGDGATAWVMTRATDFDTPAEIQPGDYVLVLNGTANTSTSWVQTATVTTVGTDAINWNKFSSDVDTLITNIQNFAFNYSQDTGAADAYVATLSPAITSYVEGLIVILNVANENATSTPTLNVNGLGVKTITSNLGNALVAGDLVAGQRVMLLYDGTNFRLLNRNYEKRAQNESFNYILDTGSLNAYVATLTPAVTAYVEGLRISLKIANTNDAASTLNVNALGTKSIKLLGGADVQPGNLLAGYIADLRYDGTNFQLMNPVNPLPEQANIIVGGNFSTNPWQRQVTFTSVASGTFTADRFKWIQSGSGVVDILKTADAPTVAQAGVYSAHCLNVDVTTADAAIAAGDFYCHQYPVEGYDISQSGFGQSGTRYITLSFWHKHTVTGTYCVGFGNSAANRSYIAEYTQSVADTWEFVYIPVPVDTTGTWLYTTGIGLSLYFVFAAGSTYQAPGGAGSWQAGNYIATSNQVNGLSAATNFNKLALVKLEPGIVATRYPFETEDAVLNRAEHYYEKSYDGDVYPGAAGDFNGATNVILGALVANAVAFDSVMYSVTKRETPTVTWYSPTTGASGVVRNQTTAADISVNASSAGWTGHSCTNQTGGNIADGTRISGHWVASAEL